MTDKDLIKLSLVNLRRRGLGMFKKLLKKKQHDYELMCEDFTRCLAHTIFDARMLEVRDEYEEAKKDCKFGIIGNHPGIPIPVMTEPTEKFLKVYNEGIVNYSIKFVNDIGIYQLKRKGSVMKVWCDRPGLLIGPKGVTIKAFLEKLKTGTYNTKVTHLDKIRSIKFVGTRNPFTNGALSLQYNYAVKKVSKEEI